MIDNTGNGLLLPTTDVWDVTEIYETEVNSPEFKELLVRLYQNLNRISMTVNLKDSAYYDQQEFVTSGNYFPNPLSVGQQAQQYRPINRIVVNFGSLPNSTTKSIVINLGLNLDCTAVRLYGTATNPSTGQYIPIPYASNVANMNIELNAAIIDANITSINITTASDYSAYTKVVVVFEFLRF